MTLQGQSLFSGATVKGAGALFSAGAAGATTVSGLTLGGGVDWTNIRTVTQKSGSLTLGDSSSAAATLTNAKAGTYNIIDDSDVALGGDGFDQQCRPVREDRRRPQHGRAQHDQHRPRPGGERHARLARRDLRNRRSMQVKNGATLQLDGTVASTQSLSYGAGGGQLFLNDLAVSGAQLFHGVIHGWAAGDLIDIGTAFGAQVAFNFAENAGHTGGVLSLSGGGASAAIGFNGLSGTVSNANFTLGADSHGGAMFAFHA